MTRYSVGCAAAAVMQINLAGLIPPSRSQHLQRHRATIMPLSAQLKTICKVLRRLTALASNWSENQTGWTEVQTRFPKRAVRSVR